MRLTDAIWLLLILLFTATSAAAQSTSGTVSGIVLDPAGKAIAGADVEMVNDATRVRHLGATNNEGIYAIPNLPPGPYRIQVSKIGFKTLIKPDIILNVQDALSINFTLTVGAASETVTVKGGAPLIDTENAAVGTVIDRNFIENLPLNGRSFNTLLQLTPGVIIAPSYAISSGQFSISGQRTDANTFSVDGVSANFGVAASGTLGQSGTGTAQAFSALGGTSSLVSVEALEEFRVETSSFAPEFGRSPGGQVILSTRAGTNDFHGGGYDYFRNDALDANNWFANNAGQPRAPERHNDFGAFLGGRILRDKTFFFTSYEGARLRLPQTSSLEVPSDHARQQASPALAPLLNAYPEPNGQGAQSADVAPFIGSFSNTATLNSGSVRIDHAFSDRFSIFGRFNDAPSETADRVYGLSTTQSMQVDTKTLTLGANMSFSSRRSNILRGNYSTQQSDLTNALDSFDGAARPDLSILLGPLPGAQSLTQFQTFDTSVLLNGPLARNQSKQLNVVDDFSDIIGAHQFKFGADSRALFLDVNGPQYVISFSSPSVEELLSSGSGSVYAARELPARILTQSTSLYGQDTWKIGRRLTITYGFRWELDPAPSARGETTLAAWRNLDTPANISLAPLGTSLWSTTLGDFAPRMGVAYSPGGDFVIRAGWGIFYDTGVGQAASVATSFPNSFAQSTGNVSIPIANPDQLLLPVSRNPPYPDGIDAFAPNLKLPRSQQWNLALEKAFSGNQALSVTYVGQAGRKLLRQEALYRPNSNFTGDFLLTQNDAYSNYDALQIQYRKPLSARVQALMSYTCSHSLDNASSDVVTGISSTVISAATDYAGSDFDVRQSFSGAVLYQVPAIPGSGSWSWLTRDWALNTVIVARSGFPFNAIVLGNSPDPNGYAVTRPDKIQGQPFWLSNYRAPGGRSLNADAFSIPSIVRQGTEGRNDISGFGLTQVDSSLFRKFPIHESLNLQFRVDAFNVLNHPNFTNPPGYVQFGQYGLQSQQMLNAGLGGLNALFQEGGPRSLQLSLHLSF